MANPEKKGIIGEIGDILIKTGVVVGILGFIAKFINVEFIEKVKRVIYPPGKSN